MMAKWRAFFRANCFAEWIIGTSLILSAVLLPRLVQAGAFDAPAFDAYVEKTMREWNVPGLAVAIVNREGVIHQRGYGTRLWGKSQPVDANTIFAIGSNGKSFTAVLLGALSDQGRVRLDEPVSRYLPGFRMVDSYAGANLSFEDALAHIGGLPEQSGLLAWYLFGLDRQEMIDLVARTQPATSLRGGFAYNNTMFTVAGEAAARIAGTSYEEAVRVLVLKPLGMSRTSISLAVTRSDRNVARPHAYVNGIPVPVPYHDVTGAAPAGAVNSTVSDMARYVRMFLNNGSLDRRAVLSAETAASLQMLRRTFIRDEMSSVQQMFSLLSDPSLVRDLGYGLGLAHVNYAGVPFVMHGGNIDGMTSWMAWSDQADIGFVALSNAGNMLVPAMLMFSAVNPKLELPDDDILGRLLPLRDEINKGPVVPQVAGILPSALAPDAMAGSYRNYLGLINIRATESLLRMRIERTGYEATLQHLNRDSYAIVWDNPALPVLLLSFRVDIAGLVSGFDMVSGDEFKLYGDDGKFEKLGTDP